MKFSVTGGEDAWPADWYLNIWVCHLGRVLLGYAQFSGGPAKTDGVVITYTGFGIPVYNYMGGVIDNFSFGTGKYKGQTMTGLPDEIFRKWMHSFEEDTNGIVIYRPVEYEFPRARGRNGIEFKPDGMFIAWKIGPTDTNRGINGHWKIEGSRRVRVSFEDNVREPRVLEIIQCDTGILKMRELSVSS